MKFKYLIGASASVLALATASQATAADYHVTVTNLTSGIHFTPLIVATHNPSVAMFSSGTRASEQLQAIAEGGDISGMASLLESIGAGVATGDGLVAPSMSADFMVSGNPGDVLSLAGMLLPTNDGFVGLNSVHLPQGSMTYSYNANGYDAGTEGNDEVIGSGAPGEAGFPAPPPIVASGTGTGASGIHVPAEGYVHIHRNVIGDLDPNGGVSDINAAVHRWLNPVARVTITRMGDGSTGAVSAVNDLRGQTYSSTAVEIFWQPATTAAGHITGYEVSINGEVVASIDGQSYFQDGLSPATDYMFQVTAMDSNGNRGEPASITLRTNDN
ncbi:MAG: spondin domain-containing protein [Gammaproteobacteria bacterium]|nr:spondin domain-containing protein [Gammaproteobacteria bacterium]